jgi:hypothetical protein
MILNRNRLIQLGFAIVLALYAGVSRPIPATVGPAEALIAAVLLLIVVVGATRLPATSGSLVGAFAFLWLLIVPTGTWLIRGGASYTDYARDVVPLFFLALPLAMSGLIRKDPERWVSLLHWGLIGSGFALSLRYLLVAGESAFQVVYADESSAPINQCPSVIYAAVCGLAMGLASDKSILKRCALLVVGCLATATLMMSVMRAQVLIVGVAVLLSITLTGGLKNLLALGTVLGLSLVASATLGIALPTWLSGPVEWTVAMMQEKTANVGFANARDQELDTVAKIVMSSFTNFFVGAGWGDTKFFTTADAVARYTHNGVLFVLWKTGLAGLLVTTLYLRAAVFPRGMLMGLMRVRKSAESQFILVAAFSAILIFGIVEMGYKMLTFGIVLALVRAVLVQVDTRDNSR